MTNFIKSFITAKIGSPMSLCDDHYAYNLDKLKFAISDGASCNLASRIYSRLLVDNFYEHGANMFTDDICNKMCDIWRTETDQMINLLGNPYFLRGMFDSRKEAAATFVGMEITKDSNNNVIWNSYVIGDSVLIFIPKGKLTPSILFTTNKKERLPNYTDKVVFDNSPLAAHPYNSQTWRNQVWNSEKMFLLEGTYLFMTDALAEWFIVSKHDSVENKFKQIISLESYEDFIFFIKDERNRKMEDNSSPLHDDDVTLLILNIDDTSTIFNRGSISELVRENYRYKLEQETKQEIFKQLDAKIVKVEQINQKLQDEFMLLSKNFDDYKFTASNNEKKVYVEIEEKEKKISNSDQRIKMLIASNEKLLSQNKALTEELDRIKYSLPTKLQETLEETNVNVNLENNHNSESNNQNQNVTTIQGSGEEIITRTSVEINIPQTSEGQLDVKPNKLKKKDSPKLMNKEYQKLIMLTYIIYIILAVILILDIITCYHVLRLNIQQNQEKTTTIQHNINERK